MTREAWSYTSAFFKPTIAVFTGPCEGNNSLYACAWNCVIASDNNGCVTPEAPLKGLDGCVYLKPNRSSPLV